MATLPPRRFNLEKIANVIPAPVFQRLTYLGMLQIPMMLYIRPQILEFSDASVSVKVRLNHRTKNHLNTMYFGALSVGADCVTGFFPLKLGFEYQINVPPLIKRVEADFLKRPDGDAVFTCNQGLEVTELYARTLETGERVEMPLHVIVTVPSRYGQEPVAKYTQILSMKKPGKLD